MGRGTRQTKKSLMVRNVTINVLIVLSVAFSITFISYLISSKQITKEIEAQLTMELSNTVDKIQAVRDNLGVQLSILGSSQDAVSILEQVGDVTLDSEAESMKTVYGDNMENLLLISKEGIVLYDSFETANGVDVSDRSYFQDSLKGNTSHSDILQSKATGSYVEVTSAPVTKDGKVIGVIAVSMNVNYINEMLEKIKIGQSGYAFLLDQNGKFIYHPKKELIQTPLKDLGVDGLNAELDRMLKGESGRIEYRFGGVQKLDIYVPLGNWSLSINAVKSEYLAEVYIMLKTTLLIALFLLIVASVISILNSYFMVKNIRTIQKVVGTVTKGDLTANLEEKNLKKCWEMQNCEKPDCPAYHNMDNLKCWEIEGTFCNNEIQGGAISKLDYCSKCKVYRVSEGDELSQMGRSLSIMVITIQKLVHGISDISEKMTSSSQELSSASEETTSTAEGIADRMEAMSAGAQDQSSYSEQVSEMAGKMNGKLLESVEKIQFMATETDHVNQQAKIGQQAMDETIKGMGQIEEQTNKLGDVMEILLSQSEEIGRINELITAIADETNLLSLNASIEAARAGENGRGFAVVAAEIGKLAQQSQDSAKGIAELIHAISDHINKANILMETEVSLVRDGINSAENSGNVFKEINNKVEGVYNEMKKVVTFVGEVKESSIQVADAVDKMSGIIEESGADIEEITAATEEQSSVSQEISALAAELASMAERLMEEVKQFKVE